MISTTFTTNNDRNINDNNSPAPCWGSSDRGGHERPQERGHRDEVGRPPQHGLFVMMICMIVKILLVLLLSTTNSTIMIIIIRRSFINNNTL